MAMLEPASMKGCSLSDIKAVLKRAGILVLTNDFLYWRPAREAEVRVQRAPLQNKRCYEPALRVKAIPQGLPPTSKEP